MEAYDNPAGRLHALLQELATHPGNQRFRDAWAEVLQVEVQQVKLRLGKVGQLIAETEQAAHALGDDAFEQMVTANRPAWEVAVYPDSSGYEQPFEKVGFNEASLNPLAVVASHLRTVRPEGKVPTEQRTEQLREDVFGLIDEVRGADDLPVEVQDLVIARLKDILHALDDVRVGGPRAVQRAVEVLVSEIDLHRDAKFLSKKLRQRINRVVVCAWFACGLPAQAIANWEGFEKLVDAPLHKILPPEDCPPEEKQRQLPPPKPQLESGQSERDGGQGGASRPDGSPNV
jgi:hypothetical protein